MGDVVVCIMDEAGFKHFMQCSPNVCLALFRYMTQHHVHDMQRLGRLLYTKAADRVVLTLLDLGSSAWTRTFRGVPDPSGYSRGYWQHGRIGA